MSPAATPSATDRIKSAITIAHGDEDVIVVHFGGYHHS